MFIFLLFYWFGVVGLSVGRRGVTRRGFLTVAVSAIVAGVVAGVGAYYAGLLSAPVKEVTKTVTSTTTLAPGAPVTTTVTVTQPPITVTKTETVTVTATPKISGEPIKIAVLINLSGSVAGFGMRSKLMFDAVAKELINDKGGVYVRETGAYHKIQLIYYDCESNPARAAELATKVATEKQAHFIFLNSGPPPLTVPAAINVEKVGGTPAIVEGCTDVHRRQTIPAVGGKVNWVWFLHFSLADLALKIYVPFFTSVKDRTNGVFAFLAEDDPDGHFLVEDVKMLDLLKKAGYEVVFPGLLPPGVKDLTAVITRFKEAGVEAFFGNLMPSTTQIFLSQSQLLGFKPKVVYISRGVIAAGGPEPFGDVVEDVVISLLWWVDYPFPGNDWIRENWDRISGGLSYSTFEGYAYAWMQAVLEAIKIAGSLDPKKLNDAMLKLDFLSAPGRVKFDPTTHICNGFTVCGQVVKTPEGKWQYKVVWAPEGSGIPTQPLRFPKRWP
jgi:branched-chain amino acid transport system substrate-binding protein